MSALRDMLAAGLVAWVSIVGSAAAQENGDKRQPAPSQDVAPVKQKVMHLRLLGDLDNGQLVADFADAAASLRADGVDLLVLELDGDAWRPDVLAGMFDVVRAARLGSGVNGDREPGLPWVVWLNDPTDRRIGTAAAALGVLADACYLGPRTEIVFEPDDDVRRLAPPAPEVNWAQVEQDLQAAVWGRLKERGGDLLLAAALPLPRQPLWLARVAPGDESASPPLRIHAAEPTGDTVGPVLTLCTPKPASGGLRLLLRGDAAAGLGLSAGEAREIGQLLVLRQVIARPLVRKTIESGLAPARERLARDIKAIDAAREQIDRLLDAAERARGVDADRQRRRAGNECIRLADEAARCLMACEKLTETYPELLRGVPPGQTAVGLSELRLGMAWTSLFQTRRQAITDLRARAARLLE